MKFVIGYLDDEGEFIRVNPFDGIKHTFLTPVRLLFNFLDKFNHPIICRITHRHKSDNDSLFLPRKCKRCKIKLELNLMIDDKIINGAMDAWKEYCRIVPIKEILKIES